MCRRSVRVSTQNLTKWRAQARPTTKRRCWRACRNRRDATSLGIKGTVAEYRCCPHAILANDAQRSRYSAPDLPLMPEIKGRLPSIIALSSGAVIHEVPRSCSTTSATRCHNHLRLQRRKRPHPPEAGVAGLLCRRLQGPPWAQPNPLQFAAIAITQLA